MNKLTASIVGGGTGGRLSLEAIAASDYYEPLALADLRLEVGAELGRKFPELRTFTDFREMFRLCPTDVVCVSTYPPSHEAVTSFGPVGLLIARKLSRSAGDLRSRIPVRETWSGNKISTGSI